MSSEALYLDTSAVLRAVLESGTTPEVEERIRRADRLFTSRLSLVEAARAFQRLRTDGILSEEALADAARTVDRLWARCHIMELSPEVCALASTVSPGTGLRTLDALHLATYLSARHRVGDVELLTVDQRMMAAAGTI